MGAITCLSDVSAGEKSNNNRILWRTHLKERVLFLLLKRRSELKWYLEKAVLI